MPRRPLSPRVRPFVKRGALVLIVAGAFAGQPLVAQTDSASRNALFRSISWVDGPVVSRLASIAELRVPDGCRFTDAKGAAAFMQATENPPSGNESGILICRAADSAQSPWFVVFSYDAAGYVRDDERDSLDADAILNNLRTGTAAANEERAKHGWTALTIDGWIRPPYYDSATHNLTWSTRAHSEGPIVNHSVRLLGRAGVLHADLVTEPDQLGTAVPAFDHVIAGTHFLAGNTYAEWRQGDKVAAYGLTALIAGGAGVAAAKLGLFAKLWKVVAGLAVALWKALVALAVGVGARFKKVFGRKKSQSAAPPSASSQQGPG